MIFDIGASFGRSLSVTDNGVNVCVDNRLKWRYRWRVRLTNIGRKKIVNIYSYIPMAVEMAYAKRGAICVCCCCPSRFRRNRPPMRVIIQS